MSILSVLIPTYNRKNGLIKTLRSLQKQQMHEFKILISDNCSNYSIENEVLNLFDEAFRKRISVFHQPYNVGGTNNIIGLLGLCQTKWGWLLGDDDNPNENAIEMILDKIEQFSEIGAIWVTLEEYYDGKNNKILDSMNDLLSTIKSIKKNRSGDFIFCSNKIYNIEMIRKHMEITHRFNYTRITQCFPMIELLKERKSVLVVRGNPVVEHSGGSPTWDINKTVSGLSTLIDYPTGLTWENHCEFVKNIMFSPKFVFSCYLKTTSLPWNYRSYLKNVYNCCYKYCYHGIYRVYLMLFCYIGSSKYGFSMLKKLYTINRK